MVMHIPEKAKWEPAAFLSAMALVWAAGVFAGWTLVHSLATFGHIPWAITKHIGIAASAAVTLLAIPIGFRFFSAYADNLDNGGSPFVFPVSDSLLLLFLIVILCVLPNYTLKFFAAGLAFMFRHIGTTGKRLQCITHSAESSILKPCHVFCLFTLLVLAATAFTLCAYRSDYDDAEFIQIAIQTLMYPERAPLTFDASLGEIVEAFRFQPYRFASYETLVALISDLCSLEVMTAYYLVLPTAGSILCMCAAYLLARWFLGERGALAALLFFLLILIAWGETHIAYGNRVFVRLFQGKGWLIAVTTPFCVQCGLLLLRTRIFAVWLCYLAANIAAVGVSSSGLVISCGTALLLSPLAMEGNTKKIASNLLAIGSGAAYALLCGLILNVCFQGAGDTQGTVLPINASLGENVRESITLALLSFSACLRFGTRRRKELALLAGSALFLILNPWGSEIIGRHSAMNMCWRFAWAAPVPILCALLLGCFFEQDKEPGRRSSTRSIAGGCLLGIFLVAAPWTCRPGNNDFHFALPQWKIPYEYAEVTRLAALLPDKSDLTVLAPARQGTWLTVTSPGMRLVMPGHGYLSTLHNLMPPEEFTQRIASLKIVEDAAPLSLDCFFSCITKFRIGYIVAPQARSREILEAVNASGRLRADKSGVTENFDVLRISHLPHNDRLEK